MEETKTDRAKRLANIRQKRYYKANAEHIRKVAQTDRDELIKLRAKCDCATVVETPQSKIVEFNKVNVLAGLDSLEMNAYTKSRYIRDITTVFRLTDCDDLRNCLKNFKTIKKLLETSKQLQKPDTPYSTNSKKGLVQSILFTIDKFNIPMNAETRKLYNNYFEELKIASSNLTKFRQSNPEFAVMLFPDYLSKMLEQYGEDSKQYLIARLYSEVPARDNFYDLEIIPSVRKNDKSFQNYLVLPRNKTAPLKVVIQSYKTIARYGVKTITLSPELSMLIRQYIISKNLTTHLFPENKKGLTAYITAMNKRINVVGGINTLRKMYATTALSNEDITPKQRLELATEMMHSPVMSLNYQRLVQ